MRIKFKNKWVQFRYHYWSSKEFFYSRLIDGFILNILRVTIIAKLKG